MQDQFRVGDWILAPRLGRAAKGDQTVHLRAKVMDLAVFFAQHPGEVISKDEILNAVWRTTHVSESALTRVLTELRQLLGDSVEHPWLIETIPKRGYRLIAPVAVITHPDQTTAPARDSGISPVAIRPRWQWATALDMRWGGATIALVLALLAGSGSVSQPASRGTTSVLDFAPRDSVLIAAFENLTRVPELDGVTDVIEHHLANSNHLLVVSPERIEDTLTLLKKPVDSVIDEALARDIAVRDDSIRVLVSGRLERLGSTYSIRARIIEAPNRRVLAVLNENAARIEDLSEACYRLASRIRQTLGERLRVFDVPASVERVSTRSLNALRLYNESFKLGRRNKWPGALELIQQAMREDPEFATGLIWLAWAMRNTNAAAESYLPVAQRAIELSAQATQWERLWITASYYTMVGDHRRAEGAYQALLQLKPDYFWGVQNLIVLYQVQNRRHEAIPYILKLAELRPNDAWAHYHAAHAVASLENSFERARPYVERARHLGISDEVPIRFAWAQYFEAAEFLARRDVPGVNREVERILGNLAAQPIRARDELVAKGIRYFLATGQIRRAMTAVDQLHDRKFLFPFYRAQIAYCAGDRATAREYLTRIPFNSFVNPSAWYLVKTGMAKRALALIESGPRRGAGNRPMLEWVTAVAAENPDATLQPLMTMAESRIPGHHARIASELARTWLRKGETARATEVLKMSWTIDPLADADDNGPYAHEWMPNALLLAELHRRSGRVADAQRIELDVRRLLSAADADYFLLRNLQTVAAITPQPSGVRQR